VSPQASSIALSLPWVVFIWQVIGAASAFRPTPGQRGLSPLAQLISLAFIGVLFHRQPLPLNAALVAIGWVGLVTAFVLFEWARRTIRGKHFSYIFSADTPAFLCTDGPFHYVRNPFYSSYLLSIGSVAVMMPSVFRAAIVAAMVIYFSAAAMWEERKFARSPVAAEYAAYKATTGRFVPKWRRV
jgi:protein-S-isoprenylcysteine O-methyltransferase Ste14